jgi:hypothetical protein
VSKLGWASGVLRCVSRESNLLPLERDRTIGNHLRPSAVLSFTSEDLVPASERGVGWGASALMQAHVEAPTRLQVGELVYLVQIDVMQGVVRSLDGPHLVF